MVKKEKALLIKQELEKLYPHTETFLHYTKDYELLFAVILSAQATDRSVNEATAQLFVRCPDLEAYTEENKDLILSLISKVGLGKTKCQYLIKTAALLREKHHGVLPRDRKALMTFPGVGYKTSGVVLAELYDFPFIPVDTHVYRVTHRLGIVRKELNFDETELALEKLFQGQHMIQIHRQFILLGRNVCKAANPNCFQCPMRSFCDCAKKKPERI